MRLPADFVELRADDRELYLLVRLAEGTPTIAGGMGGWEVVPRPGRRPLTVWRGPSDALTMTLPLVFDRYTEGVEGGSVEADVRTLEKMGGLDRGDPEPPRLSVEGSLPHDESRTNGANEWVLTEVRWGDAIRRASDGHRVRQFVEVELALYTQDDRVERLSIAKRPSYTFTRSKAGETFEKIAARKLGSRRFGARLARLNGRGSGAAATRLKTNTKVRLPSADALRDWKRGR